MNEIQEKAQFAVHAFDTWWEIHGFLRKNTLSQKEFNLIAYEARILFLDKNKKF